MTRSSLSMDVELSTDPFYSKDNIDELERRAVDVNSGKSTMKEHELIEIESSNAGHTTERNK